MLFILALILSLDMKKVKSCRMTIVVVVVVDFTVCAATVLMLLLRSPLLVYTATMMSEYWHLIRPRFGACGAQEPEPHNADSMGSKGSSTTYMARDDTVPEKCLANP